MLSEWFALTPLFIFALALLYLPGVLVLRIAGFRGTLMVAGAVPVSLGIVAASGVVARNLNVPWGMPPLLTGTFAVAGFAWMVARLILGKLPSVVTPATLARPKYASATTIITVVWVSLMSAAAVVNMRAPDLPVQQIDATFHQSLPWIITQSGDASMFSAPGYAMGMRAISTYYPMVWHILVATIGGPQQIIEASNVMLVLLPFIWFMGLGALALEAFPRSRWAPAAVVSAGMLFPAFPSYMQVRLPVWPNALGLVLIPAIVALLLRCLRLLETFTEVGRRRSLIALLGFILAYLGGIATYPITLFATLFLIIPLAGGILLRIREVIAIKFGRKVAFVSALAAIALVGVMLLLLAVWNPNLIAFLFRDSYASFADILGKLKAMITMWPLGGGGKLMYLAYLLIAGIIGLGLVIAFRHPKQRWVVYSWIIAFVMLAAAYFPLGPLTSLTGLWYNSPYRLIPLLILPTALLTGSIWQWVENKIVQARPWQDPRRLQLLGAVLTVLLAVVIPQTTYAARAQLMEPEDENPDKVPVFLADESEIEMLQRLRTELDPNLMVLGDPTNGSTLVEPISGHRTVFPHITFRTLDTDALYLAQHFNNLKTDPRVCQILRHYGIGYYYQDEPGKVSGMNPKERAPGLYNVDTSTGFELVDSADTAKVFKIEACGEIHKTSSWWVQDSTFEPLFDKHGNRNNFDKDGRLHQPGKR